MIFSKKKKILSAFLSLTMIASMAAVPFSASADTATAATVPGISYKVQVQNKGWMGPFADGATAGTVHQSLRVETLNAQLTNAPAGAVLQYQAHVQNIGWQAPVTGGQDAGTVHQSLRVEALRMTIKNMPGYAVKYRVQQQNVGWTDWVTVNNNTDVTTAPDAGKTGKSLRLEAIEVQIINNSFEVASVTSPNAKTAVINFTQPVNKDSVVDAGGLLKNISFTPIGTAALINATPAASLSADGKALTVTPSSTDYFDGDYAVLVKSDVTDATKDANPIKSYSSVVTLKDTARPTITGVTYPVFGTARISFSEPIATAIAGGMTIVSDAGTAVAPVVLKSDNTSIDLDISLWAKDKAYAVTFVGLKDYAGNMMTPNPTTLSVVNTKTDTTAPTVVSIVPTSWTSMKVTFSEPLTATTDGIATYSIDAGAAVKIKIGTNATLDSTKTVATVTGLGFTKDEVHNVTIDNFKDLSGNPGTSTAKFVKFAKDTTPPAVVSSKVVTIGNTQYLVVKYSEDVTINSDVAVTTALTGTYLDVNYVTKDMIAIAKTKVSAVDGTTDSIKIELPADAAGTYTATITDKLLVDGDSNTSAAQAVSFVLGAIVADPTAPSVSGVVTNAAEDTVTVTFNKDVTFPTACNVNNYTVEGVNVFKSAILDGSANKVKLTLNPNAFTVTGDRILNISNVATAAGKVMTPYSSVQNFVKNTKPTIKSAAFTDSATIVVTFSEAVSAAGTTDFDFYIDGVKQTGVSNAAISGTTATITVTAITDLSKTYQIKYVGSDIIDGTTPGNHVVSGALITVTK